MYIQIYYQGTSVNDHFATGPQQGWKAGTRQEGGRTQDHLRTACSLSGPGQRREAFKDHTVQGRTLDALWTGHKLSLQQ